MKVLTYQSSFNVPMPPLGTQAGEHPWSETGGNTDRPARTRAVTRGLAAQGRSQFAAFNLAPITWDLQQSPQPPHPRPEKAAALMRGDDGAQAAFARWRNAGWEVQPPQPPHPRPEKAGALARGDDGAEAKLVVFHPHWESILQPTTHPRPERSGAVQVGDAGTESTFNVFYPVGWEPALPPSLHLRPERSGAVARWEDGVEAALSVQLAVFGWEAVQPQPSHPRPERAGAVQAGEQGTEAQFVPAPPALTAWGYEAVQTWRAPAPNRGAGISGRSMFASFTLQPMGWEVQPVQPPHPRPERSGAVQRGDDGAEAAFVPPVALTAWGYDQAMFVSYRLNRVSATKGKTEFAIFPPFVPWWEVQPPQPNRPRPEKAGAIAAGDQGTEAQFAATVIAIAAWGHEQPPTTQRLKLTRGVAAQGRSMFASFTLQPVAWDLHLPPQPPHPRPERAGAVQAGDAGNESAFVPPVPLNAWGFEYVLQPPHPRPERFGAVARGDDGTEAKFVPTILTAWGYDYFVQPPHRRPERAGAIMIGEAGTEAKYVVVVPPMGWEVQSVQPPHRFPKHSPFWSDGNSATFARWFNAGWEVQPPQPPHPRPERSGAVARGDDGNESPYKFWLNAGWEVAPHQPQHPRPERSAAAILNFNIDATYKVFYPHGWPVHPVQPPHPRPERAGALARGDDGAEGTFVFSIPPPMGWEPTLPLMRRQWAKYVGAFLGGDQGTYSPLRVTVFYALSTITAAGGKTTVTYGRGSTQIGAASARTVVKSDPKRR